MVFLLVALTMLVVGQTLLRDRFSKTAFALYWLCCFAFTFLAILVALLDAIAVRRNSRREHRAFLEETLREIASRQKTAANPKSKSPDSSRDEGAF